MRLFFALVSSLLAAPAAHAATYFYVYERPTVTWSFTETVEGITEVCGFFCGEERITRILYDLGNPSDLAGTTLVNTVSPYTVSFDNDGNVTDFLFGDPTTCGWSNTEHYCLIRGASGFISRGIGPASWSIEVVPLPASGVLIISAIGAVSV